MNNNNAKILAFEFVFNLQIKFCRKIYMENNQDVLAILKLYELRRDEQMRAARQWYSSEFSPNSAMDIINLYRAGERASANFRMVVSYWDMAASFCN